MTLARGSYKQPWAILSKYTLEFLKIVPQNQFWCSRPSHHQTCSWSYNPRRVVEHFFPIPTQSGRNHLVQIISHLSLVGPNTNIASRGYLGGVWLAASSRTSILLCPTSSICVKGKTYRGTGRLIQIRLPPLIKPVTVGFCQDGVNRQPRIDSILGIYCFWKTICLSMYSCVYM